jgi:cystathionine beta-lyase
MPYNLDTIIDRRRSDSTKWNRYQEDVLPLWVADMDFRCPEPVLRALHERVEHGILGYAAPPPELAEAIRARLHALYGWQVTAEDIVFVPGVVPGFNLACRAVSRPGDAILVQPPVYHPFLRVARCGGLDMQCAEVHLTGQGDAGPRYEIDMDAFEATITAQTSAFLFCNPHNPVGRVYERTELERLAEICLRHEVVICSDEIHCDLLYSGQRHTPIAALAPEVAQATITLMAPSKTFNIAGLQCSFAVIQNSELRQAFGQTCAGLAYEANLLGYAAALAAYTEGQPWLNQVLAYLEANRDFLRTYVAAHLPGIEMIVPEGTFLAWLDCRKAGISGAPGEFFLRQARVALNEGSTFGPGGEGFVRLNLACPRAILVEALERMRKALEL